MSDPAITAAADQAHAESEQILSHLIKWWGDTRPTYKLGKSDEVAVLTYILSLYSPENYGALLATAISRFVDSNE
jgi:hypothetical protein